MGRKFDFPQKVTKLAWSLAERVPGKDPNRWRCDAVGVPVLKALRSKNVGLAAYVFDHKFAPSSDVEKGNPFFRSIKNCQLLSTRVNLGKSNNNKITRQELMGYHHNLMLTSTTINLLELSAYGNVKDTNGQILHECYTVHQTMSGLTNTCLNPASTPPDKTLPLLIERFPSSTTTQKEREEFTKKQIMEIAWTEHVKKREAEPWIARGSEAEPPREPAAAPAAAAAAPSSPAPAPTPRSTSSTSNSEA